MIIFRLSRGVQVSKTMRKKVTSPCQARSPQRICNKTVCWYLSNDDSATTISARWKKERIINWTQIRGLRGCSSLSKTSRYSFYFICSIHLWYNTSHFQRENISFYIFCSFLSLFFQANIKSAALQRNFIILKIL